MFATLLQELETISPLLPTIFRFVIVVIALLLAWSVLSVPAYWLARACDSLLQQCINFLRALRLRIMAFGSELFQRRGASIDQFIETHAQMQSLTHENHQIVRAISRV